MTLPKQVRDQIARANDISKQINGEAPAPAPAPTEAPSPAPAPAAEPAPAPSPAPATTPAPAPAPSVASSKDGETGDAAFWLQKYRTLQGLHDQQRRESQAAIGELAQQVATLAARMPTSAPAPAPAPTAPKVGTEDDVRVFGNEMVDLVRRGAQSVMPDVQAQIDAALAPLVERNRQLETRLQQLNGTVQVSAQDQFFAALDQALPNWEEINATPKWLAWLDQRDPLSGLKRQALLDDAIGRHDLTRTLALFQAFGAPAPSAAAAPAPTPSAPDLSPAPRTVASTVVPSTKDDKGPLVSRSEIQKFYNDVAAGRYRNDPAGKKAMDEKIAAAVQTGRVANQ